MITATIGRNGAHPESALFDDNSTVGDALNRFGLTVGNEERIYDANVNIVNASTHLTNGTYTIAKQQENGSY